MLREWAPDVSGQDGDDGALAAVLLIGGLVYGVSGVMLLASSAVAGSVAPTVSGLNTVAIVILVGTGLTVGLTLMLRRGTVYADA